MIMISTSPDFISEAQLDFLNLLGYQYLQHGRLHHALLIYELILELDPGNSQLIFAASYAAIRCNDPEKALLFLDSLSFLYSDSAIGWLLRGKALAKLQRFSEAERAMRLFVIRRQRPQLHEQ